MKKWFFDIPVVNRIRKWAGEYFLRQEMRIRTREVQGMGLDSARSIGIIFKAKDELTFKLIHEFYDKLRGGGIRRVKVLVYVPKDGDVSSLQSSQDFDFFTREDFNWYYKPQGKKVVDFMSEPFDILIDLRLNKFISLLYMVGLSRAHFKVGCFGKNYEDFYDLMIDVEANPDVAYFIEQIQHYLKMLEGEKK